MIDFQVQVPEGHNARLQVYSCAAVTIELDGCDAPELDGSTVTVDPGEYAEVACRGCGRLAAVTVEGVTS